MIDRVAATTTSVVELSSPPALRLTTKRISATTSTIQGTTNVTSVSHCCALVSLMMPGSTRRANQWEVSLELKIDPGEPSFRHTQRCAIDSSCVLNGRIEQKRSDVLGIEVRQAVAILGRDGIEAVLLLTFAALFGGRRRRPTDPDDRELNRGERHKGCRPVEVEACAGSRARSVRPSERSSRKSRYWSACPDAATHTNHGETSSAATTP